MFPLHPREGFRTTLLASQVPEDTYALIWYPGHRYVLAFHDEDDIKFYKGLFENAANVAAGPKFELASHDRLRDVYLAKDIHFHEKAFIMNYLALTE